jgi:hypothetical protein
LYFLKKAFEERKRALGSLIHSRKFLGYGLSQNQKKEGRFCCAFGCNNKPVAKLAGLCYKHYQRKRRQADPVGVRFTQFRINALNRKKDFGLRLKNFA